MSATQSSQSQLKKTVAYFTKLLDHQIHSHLVYGFTVLFSAIVCAIVANTTVHFLEEFDELSIVTVAMANKSIPSGSVLGIVNNTDLHSVTSITNIAVSQIGTSNVRVSWQTSQEVTAYLLTDTKLPLVEAGEAGLVANFHSREIKNLPQEKPIFFRIKIQGVTGEVSSVVYKFYLASEFDGSPINLSFKQVNLPEG